MRQNMIKMAVAIVCAAAAGQSFATKVQNVATSQDESEVSVIWDFDTNTTQPSSFKLQNPNRLVLDWKGVTEAPEKRNISWDANTPSSIQHFFANNQLRAMVNLDGFSDVKIQQNGTKTELKLFKQPVKKEANMIGPFKNVDTVKAPLITEWDKAGKQESKFVEGRTTSTLEKSGLTDVKMQRGNDGNVKFFFQLSSEKATGDAKMDGNKLVVTLPNVKAVDVLNKYTDTRSISSLVQGYDVKNTATGAIANIETRGPWTFSSYQTGQQLVVEIKQQKEEVLSTGSDVKNFKGNKLSMNFQNLDVRTALQLLADFSGQNIVVSDSVQGTIALRLKDVPWDQALDLVLDSKGLDMVQRNNVIWVAPRQEIQQKEQAEADRENTKTDKLPLRTASYQLNYQRAEQVKDLLANKDQRILSKRGAVSVDSRTNTVFVNDVSTKLEEVSNLIKKIDVPMRQVQIEARIVEASETFAKELGAKVGYTESSATSYGGGNVQGRIPNGLSSLPASGINGSTAGTLSFLLFNNSMTKLLNVELSALVSDGNGKIVSSPRVVTADQTEATIEQGTEIPYQKATSSGATSIEFKKAVMSLNVKPQITPEGKVILDLKINKDSIGVTTLSGPSIDTKKVNTQVLVENGGTVAIGGIIAEEDRTTVNKVPFFGDIPIIGALFTQTSKATSKKELLVLITPKIVMEDGALVNTKTGE